MSMSKRDLTKNEVDENQPIILSPQKTTLMRYVNVGSEGERDRIAGLKIEGYAYTLKEHPSDPERLTISTPKGRPASRFYILTIWDAFAAELIDYERKELKKDNKELLFLVGSSGFIKLYDGTYTVLKQDVERVMSVAALIDMEGRREGIDEEEVLDDDVNSLSI